MAGMLTEWEDSAMMVKGTCIRVEIVSEDGKLQDMYFQRPAKVSQFWGARETNEAYEKMMYECNRSNNGEEKLRSFLSMQVCLCHAVSSEGRLALRVEYEFAVHTPS